MMWTQRDFILNTLGKIENFKCHFEAGKIKPCVHLGHFIKCCIVEWGFLGVLANKERSESFLLLFLNFFSNETI